MEILRIVPRLPRRTPLQGITSLDLWGDDRLIVGTQHGDAIIIPLPSPGSDQPLNLESQQCFRTQVGQIKQIGIVTDDFLLFLSGRDTACHLFNGTTGAPIGTVPGTQGCSCFALMRANLDPSFLSESLDPGLTRRIESLAAHRGVVLLVCALKRRSSQRKHVLAFFAWMGHQFSPVIAEVPCDEAPVSLCPAGDHGEALFVGFSKRGYFRLPLTADLETDEPRLHELRIFPADGGCAGVRLPQTEEVMLLEQGKGTFKGYDGSAPRNYRFPWGTLDDDGGEHPDDTVVLSTKSSSQPIQRLACFFPYVLAMRGSSIEVGLLGGRRVVQILPDDVLRGALQGDAKLQCLACTDAQFHLREPASCLPSSSAVFGHDDHEPDRTASLFASMAPPAPVRSRARSSGSDTRSEGRGDRIQLRFFAATKQTIFELVPKPFEEAVTLFATRKFFRDALGLCNMLDDDFFTAGKPRMLASIRRQYGLSLFETYRFDEAMHHFQKGRTDPLYVVSLFQEHLPMPNKLLAEIRAVYDPSTTDHPSGDTGPSGRRQRRMMGALTPGTAAYAASSLPQPGTEEFAKAVRALLEYIRVVREAIVAAHAEEIEEMLAPPPPQPRGGPSLGPARRKRAVETKREPEPAEDSDEPRSQVLQNFRDLLERLDTATVQAHLKLQSPDDVLHRFFHTAPCTFCHVKTTAALLVQENKFALLRAFLFGKGEHAEALKIFSQKCTHADVADYLKSLGDEHWALITDFSKKLLDRDRAEYEAAQSGAPLDLEGPEGPEGSPCASASMVGDAGVGGLIAEEEISPLCFGRRPLGLQVFLRAPESGRPQLDAQRVYDHLQKFTPAHCIPYLDFLITHGEARPFFHDKFAVLIQERIEELKKTRVRSDYYVPVAEEQGEIGVLRRCLLQFLKKSRSYRPNELLTRFQKDDFYEEQVVLLSGVRRHKDALRILATKMSSLEAAERYCQRLFNPALHADCEAEHDVHKSLIEVYLEQTGSEDLVLRLLRKYYRQISPTEILDNLPASMPLEQVMPYLQLSFQRNATILKNSAIQTNLLKNLDIQAAMKLFDARSRHAEINHDTRCCRCHRPIHLSSFALLPDNRLMHLYCFDELNGGSSQRLGEPRVSTSGPRRYGTSYGGVSPSGSPASLSTLSAQNVLSSAGSSASSSPPAGSPTSSLGSLGSLRSSGGYSSYQPRAQPSTPGGGGGYSSYQPRAQPSTPGGGGGLFSMMRDRG